MSVDSDERIVAALDRTFDRMGVKWDPLWDPETVLNFRRRRRMRLTMGLSAACAALVLGVWWLPGKLSAPNIHPVASGSTAGVLKPATAAHRPAAAAMPAAVRPLIRSMNGHNVRMSREEPVYSSYPMKAPSGKNLTVDGSFKVAGMAGNTMTIRLDRNNQIQSAVLMNNGSPVATITPETLSAGPMKAAGNVQSKAVPAPSPSAAASSSASPVPVPLAVTPTLGDGQPPVPLKGHWVSGLPTPISSFSAAGPLVYLTDGNHWTVMYGNALTYWNPIPGSQTATVVSSKIAALPDSPNDALLIEKFANGQSMGYITNDRGKTWQQWALGTQSVSQLIAMRGRYWAVINGQLETSVDGGWQWKNLMTLDASQWQVKDFAVSPKNPNVIAASLTSVTKGRMGPILQTVDGGQTWKSIPNYPALNQTPSDMVMMPDGSLAALVNSDTPTIVTYSPGAQRWSLIPLPQADNGVGEMTASPNGDLVYSAPGGNLYRWVSGQSFWQQIAPPKNSLGDTATVAQPIMAIGNSQIMASFPSGWYIFVIPAGS